jgi:hypothetical protein
MEASDKDGLTRGNGAVLWQPDEVAVHWFRGATLNYARNALRTAWADPGRTAIVLDSERSRRGRLTYAELAEQVVRGTEPPTPPQLLEGNRFPFQAICPAVLAYFGRFRGDLRGS